MTRPNDTPHHRIFKKYYNRKIRPGYHIHHKDGYLLKRPKKLQTKGCLMDNITLQ